VSGSDCRLEWRIISLRSGLLGDVKPYEETCDALGTDIFYALRKEGRFSGKLGNRLVVADSQAAGTVLGHVGETKFEMGPLRVTVWPLSMFSAFEEE